MAQYEDIGGGYSCAALQVGMVVRNPQGKEIYVQPGDDEDTMWGNISSLDDVSEDTTDPKRGAIADMILGEYFT